MRIDASRVCREALQQRPTDRDLGTALVYAASKIYRKRSAEIGLAVLKLVEEYASRFEKTRLEILSEFAAGKVSIERAATRFLADSDLPPHPEIDCSSRSEPDAMDRARDLMAMGSRLLARVSVRRD